MYTKLEVNIEQNIKKEHILNVSRLLAVIIFQTRKVLSIIVKVIMLYDWEILKLQEIDKQIQLLI